ncbi:hypothetical protein ACFQBS_27080 [Planomonospora parontospora]|uniref:hypothetical protein n=1 Tax=Planomonospora parontospora TaxID=58119 RepID=UPI0036231069
MISLVACRVLPPARPDGAAGREVGSGYGAGAGLRAARACRFSSCEVGYAPIGARSPELTGRR